MKKSLLALALSIVMVIAMMVPAFADVRSSATVNLTYNLEEAWTWHITADAEVDITTNDGSVTVGFDKVDNKIFAVSNEEGYSGLAIQISNLGDFTDNITYEVKNGDNTININTDIVKAIIGQSVPEAVALTIHCTNGVDNTLVQKAADKKTATITFTVVESEISGF